MFSFSVVANSIRILSDYANADMLFIVYI